VTSSATCVAPRQWLQGNGRTSAEAKAEFAPTWPLMEMFPVVLETHLRSCRSPGPSDLYDGVPALLERLAQADAEGVITSCNGKDTGAGSGSDRSSMSKGKFLSEPSACELGTTATWDHGKTTANGGDDAVLAEEVRWGGEY